MRNHEEILWNYYVRYYVSVRAMGDVGITYCEPLWPSAWNLNIKVKFAVQKWWAPYA